MVWEKNRFLVVKISYQKSIVMVARLRYCISANEEGVVSTWNYLKHVSAHIFVQRYTPYRMWNLSFVLKLPPP